MPVPGHYFLSEDDDDQAQNVAPQASVGANINEGVDAQAKALLAEADALMLDAGLFPDEGDDELGPADFGLENLPSSSPDPWMADTAADVSAAADLGTATDLGTIADVGSTTDIGLGFPEDLAIELPVDTTDDAALSSPGGVPFEMPADVSAPTEMSEDVVHELEDTTIVPAEVTPAPPKLKPPAIAQADHLAFRLTPPEEPNDDGMSSSLILIEDGAVMMKAPPLNSSPPELAAEDDDLGKVDEVTPQPIIRPGQDEAASASAPPGHGTLTAASPPPIPAVSISVQQFVQNTSKLLRKKFGRQSDEELKALALLEELDREFKKETTSVYLLTDLLTVLLEGLRTHRKAGEIATYTYEFISLAAVQFDSHRVSTGISSADFSVIAMPLLVTPTPGAQQQKYLQCLMTLFNCNLFKNSRVQEVFRFEEGYYETLLTLSTEASNDDTMKAIASACFRCNCQLLAREEHCICVANPDESPSTLVCGVHTWINRLNRLLLEIRNAICLKIPKELHEDFPELIAGSDTTSAVVGTRVLCCADTLIKFSDTLFAVRRSSAIEKWLSETCYPFVQSALDAFQRIKVPFPLYVRFLTFAINLAVMDLMTSSHTLFETVMMKILRFFQPSTVALRRQIGTVAALSHHLILRNDAPLFQLQVLESRQLAAPVRKVLRAIVQRATDMIKVSNLPPQPNATYESSISTDFLIDFLPEGPRCVSLFTKAHVLKRLPAYCVTDPTLNLEPAVLAVLNVTQYGSDDTLLHLTLLDQALELYFSAIRAFHLQDEFEDGLVEHAMRLGVTLIMRLMPYPLYAHLQDLIALTLCSLARRRIPACEAIILEEVVENDLRELGALTARLMLLHQHITRSASVLSWLLGDVDMDALIQCGLVKEKPLLMDMLKTGLEPGAPSDSVLCSRKRTAQVVPLFVASSVNLFANGSLSLGSGVMPVCISLIQWVNGGSYRAVVEVLQHTFGKNLEDGEIPAQAPTAAEKLQICRALTLALKSVPNVDEGVGLVQLFCWLVEGDADVLLRLMDGFSETMSGWPDDSSEAIADGLHVLTAAAEVIEDPSMPLRSVCVSAMEEFCRCHTLVPTTSLAMAVKSVLKMVAADSKADENSVSVLLLKAINLAWQVTNTLRGGPALEDGSSQAEVSVRLFECDLRLHSLDAQANCSLSGDCPWPAEHARLSGSCSVKNVFFAIAQGLVKVCFHKIHPVRMSALKTVCSLINDKSGAYDELHEELLTTYHQGVYAAMDVAITSSESQIYATVVSQAEETFEYLVDNMTHFRAKSLPVGFAYLSGLAGRHYEDMEKLMLVARERAGVDMSDTEIGEEYEDSDYEESESGKPDEKGILVTVLKSRARAISVAVSWILQYAVMAEPREVLKLLSAGLEVFAAERVRFHHADRSGVAAAQYKAYAAVMDTPVTDGIADALLKMGNELSRLWQPTSQDVSDSVVTLIDVSDTMAQRERVNGTILVTYVFLLSLLLFDIDPTDAIIATFSDGRLPTQQELHQWFSNAIPLNQILCQFKTPPNFLKAAAEVSMETSHVAAQPKSDYSTVEGFKTLQLIRSQGLMPHPIYSLMSFLTGSRWHVVLEELPRLAKTVSLLYTDWLKLRRYDEQCLIHVAVFHTLMASYFRKHLVSCEKAEAELIDDDQLIKDYNTLVQQTKSQESLGAYSLNLQLTALHNLVVVASKLLTGEKKTVTASLKGVNLLETVWAFVEGCLDAENPSPWYNLLIHKLLPACFAQRCTQPLASKILESVVEPLTTHEAVLCESGHAWARLQCIYLVCVYCDGQLMEGESELRSEACHMASKVFVKASLAFVDELHMAVADADLSISGTRKVIQAITGWQNLPRLTDAQNQAVEDYMKMLAQVPFWRLAAEDKRSMVKILLIFLSILGQCRANAWSAQVHTVMQQLL